MSIESKAQAVKNLAIGLGVIAVGAGIIYLLSKLVGGLGEGRKKIEEGAGFLFGTSNESTAGTWLYDTMNGGPTPADSFDEAQAVKTCNLIWAQTGELRSATCQRLRDEGKLTPP